MIKILQEKMTKFINNLLTNNLQLLTLRFIYNRPLIF